MHIECHPQRRAWMHPTLAPKLLKNLSATEKRWKDGKRWKRDGSSDRPVHASFLPCQFLPIVSSFTNSVGLVPTPPGSTSSLHGPTLHAIAANDMAPAGTPSLSRHVLSCPFPLALSQASWLSRTLLLVLGVCSEFRSSSGGVPCTCGQCFPSFPNFGLRTFHFVGFFSSAVVSLSSIFSPFASC